MRPLCFFRRVGLREEEDKKYDVSMHSVLHDMCILHSGSKGFEFCSPRSGLGMQAPTGCLAVWHSAEVAWERRVGGGGGVRSGTKTHLVLGKMGFCGKVSCMLQCFNK